MAFKFFRRRQKLVLMLMVVLMVAFLIPSLFQRCDRGRGRDVTVGYVGDKKVTNRMTQIAAVDLNLLNQSLRMGMGVGGRYRAGEAAFALFSRQPDAGLAWVLLMHEAEQMGITVSNDRIDSFLAESGLTGEAYRRELANLRESGRTEKELRRAAKNYLKVTAAFLAADIETMPSLPELRHTAGNLYEKIQLAMVSLPAEDSATDVAEPSEQAIVEQFDRYKNLAPLARSNKTDYGFGYRIPNRLEISWLLINEGIVSRGVEPDEKEMMLYWDKNKDILKNRIPIPTTSTARADTQPSQPAEPPIEPKYREVPFKSFSQAEPTIRQIFMRGAVDTRMNEIISIARKTAQRFSESDEPYSAVAGEMIRPADTLLKRKVASLPFRKASVEEIIDELEHLANVKIVYPFGEHEKLTLDGKIEVKTKPWGSITLGEALERIGKEAKFPPIKWVTCAGMKGVLFASEPINLVPVSAGRTGMVGFEEITRHKVLGLAELQSGGRTGRQSLLSVVATAQEFLPPGKKQEARIKSGSDFDRAMHVPGPDGGGLLWRLVKAQATHAPKHLTDDIRKKVIKDLKIVSAFKKAIVAAKAMKTELETSGGDLEKLAEDKELDFSETKMFPRSRMQMQTGHMFVFPVPGVGADREFIKQAFTLVPSDPDNPGSVKPLAVIPLRRQRKVMLVQRIGYEPLTNVFFDSWGTHMARRALVLQRWERTVAVWFSYNSVAKRVNYSPEEQSE